MKQSCNHLSNSDLRLPSVDSMADKLRQEEIPVPPLQKFYSAAATGKP